VAEKARGRAGLGPESKSVAGKGKPDRRGPCARERAGKEAGKRAARGKWADATADGLRAGEEREKGRKGKEKEAMGRAVKGERREGEGREKKRGRWAGPREKERGGKKGKIANSNAFEL
jgi:hypothetical protein